MPANNTDFMADFLDRADEALNSLEVELRNSTGLRSITGPLAGFLSAYNELTDDQTAAIADRGEEFVSELQSLLDIARKVIAPLTEVADADKARAAAKKVEALLAMPMPLAMFGERGENIESRATELLARWQKVSTVKVKGTRQGSGTRAKNGEGGGVHLMMTCSVCGETFSESRDPATAVYACSKHVQVKHNSSPIQSGRGGKVESPLYKPLRAAVDSCYAGAGSAEGGGFTVVRRDAVGRESDTEGISLAA